MLNIFIIYPSTPMTYYTCKVCLGLKKKKISIQNLFKQSNIKKMLKHVH